MYHSDLYNKGINELQGNKRLLWNTNNFINF